MRLSCLRLPALLILSVVGLAPRAAQAASPCAASHIRWSGMSNRLYVSGDTTCTLTELRALSPREVPLELVDAAHNIWLLGANLQVEDGASVVFEGSSVGGDVDELRLRSNNTSALNARVEIRAEWGTLTFRGTRVTSWDEHAGGPDTEYDVYGRAFVRAISYLDGDTARESRMDVIDTDIGYLGYYAAESYGLVWKVRGETADHFARVDVRGDVIGSSVHHNYFGMYTFGAYGMRIAENEFYQNVQYGIDPHDDSDALLVEDNDIHHNGNHGFICSKRCDGLTVRNNVSSQNDQCGFMFHRAVTDSVFEGNLAEGNANAGFAIMDSHGNVVRDNVARGNLYGIRFSVGAADNLIEGNTIADNSMYGIYVYQGTDAPTINDGRPTGNQFTANELEGNGMGIRASDMFDNRFDANVFVDNGLYAAYLVDSDENVFSANDLGGGYIFLQGLSENSVEDTDYSEVMLGGDNAVMRFDDHAGRVFDNDIGLDTEVDTDRSTVTLTRAHDTGIVAVGALELFVTPTEGELEVDVTRWDRSLREWTTHPGTATRARFAVGDLVPGARHVLWVAGARYPLVADADGVVAIELDLGARPRRYTLAALRRPGSPAAVAPDPIGASSTMPKFPYSRF